MEEDKARSEATFRFVLQNFSKLSEATLSPPTFVKNLPWKINVMPREKHKFVGFFLECNGESESSTWSCNASADLRLISRDDFVVNFTRKIKHLFCLKEKDWGFAKFKEWDEILDPKNGYIKDDSIILEVNVVADDPDGVCEEQTLPSTSEASSLKKTDLLSKNLKDLLTVKDSCDVVLLVQGKEFKAHKLILTTRSSVFAAMFQHDTAEKQTGEVVIPDCDPESFQEFLEYLYSGCLNDMSDNSALHLFYTSDKYNVLELKAFCIKYLMQNLTLHNICDVVTLAEEYDEIDLSTATQDFFNKNVEEILITSEWKDLMKKNFFLANNLLIKMSKAQKAMSCDCSKSLKK